MSDEKLKQLKITALKARKDKSEFANTYTTLLGQYDNVKSDSDEEPDAIIEGLANKMIKDLKNKMGDEKSLKEAEALEPFGSGISDEELEKLVNQAIEKYPEKAEEYKEGNTGVLGLFVGDVMKNSGGNADGKAADKMIREKLEES